MFFKKFFSFNTQTLYFNYENFSLSHSVINVLPEDVPPHIPKITGLNYFYWEFVILRFKSNSSFNLRTFDSIFGDYNKLN